MSIIVQVRGDMLNGAIDALMWSERTELGDAIDSIYHREHIAHETLVELTEDVVNFVNLVVDLEYIELRDEMWAILKLDPVRAGIDFILSRNGHGTGFWDRGYGDAGDELHKWAKTFGAFNLIAGNDGFLYN